MTGVKMSARARFAAVVLSIGSTALGACATNPATGRRQFSLMSEGQELAIGREQDLQVRKEMGVYNDFARSRSGSRRSD
jgi:predicted Zn-dependent protease